MPQQTIELVTPANLPAAIAERERMRDVMHRVEMGQIPSTQVPTDAHLYYGRLEKLEPQIERVHQEQQRAEEYDRQMGEAKRFAYVDMRGLIGPDRSLASNIEELRATAEHFKEVAVYKAEQTFDELAPSQSMLSQDDYMHAYKLGGNRAVQEWYFEQKRELQLGRKYMLEQTQPGPGYTEEQVRLLERIARERQLSVATEVAETVAFSSMEAGAALNYLRGRAEEYNATREAIIKHHPALEKDLPAAIQVDEIQVRQVQMQQDETRDRGLAVAR